MVTASPMEWFIEMTAIVSADESKREGKADGDAKPESASDPVLA
jgi:hypothetical protein